MRTVDGLSFITTGSTTCPRPDLCDQRTGEAFEDYVRRHAREHHIGEFDSSEDAERNLGLTCFYFFHKYIWGNPTLTPQPFWEMHEFVSNWHWNESDLEQRIDRTQRLYALPSLEDRLPGEYRRFKQVEVPRECQKTTIVARVYSVWRSMREWFLKGRANYRIIIRSATGKNTRDTLAIIRRMASKSQRIATLYGVWVAKCKKCHETTTTQERTPTCPHCDSKNIRFRRLALINDTRGSGALGNDMISFRWLTDAEDADAVAAYSIWVAGLESETTGQRPDLYIWDDPQTDKNSDTPEKRHKIAERFDDSVRQLEFDGELIVCDTRKFVDDFAGKISAEPLASLFFILHRKARWTDPRTSSVLYFYPIKGNGKPALDEAALTKLENQMAERKFSAEYLNDPIDPSKTLFKREHFRLVSPEECPPEIRYGLNRDVTANEAHELQSQGLKIVAYNSCDPAGKEEQSVKGDESAIIGLRVDRYGAVYITYIAGGQWPSSRLWNEIYNAAAHNRPEFTDYEMPASEMHIASSFDKWLREKGEAIGVPVMLPMRWSHMPKGSKTSRIEQMDQWTRGGKFFVLTNAAAPEIIEKYISQWISYLISDHDDYPDATSRLIHYLITRTYRAREEEAAPVGVTTADGVSTVPFEMLGELAGQKNDGLLWGQRGRVNAA